MPFFLIEAIYELPTEGVTAATIRQQAYQAVLAGSSGSLMGNGAIWPFDTGWPAALASPGAAGMAQLGRFFHTLPWWTLRPDAEHRLLTGGIGNRAAEAVAARSTDRSFAVVYVPSSRTISVDLAQLRGPRVTARWFDPTNGRFQPITGSPFPLLRHRSLPTPTSNGAGDSDFVLVLQSR